MKAGAYIVKGYHHIFILHMVYTLDSIFGAYREQIRAGSTLLLCYVVWYVKLLLEAYEIVNWSKMGKAISELASFKEKLQETFTIC